MVHSKAGTVWRMCECSVQTDSTLTGDGTSDDPLSVDFDKLCAEATSGTASTAREIFFCAGNALNKAPITGFLGDKDPLQYLTTDASGNLVWLDIPAGTSIPSGGTAGQYLTPNGSGFQWTDLPAGSSLPSGGTAGQYLTPDGSGGFVWTTLPSGSGGGSGAPSVTLTDVATSPTSNATATVTISAQPTAVTVVMKGWGSGSAAVGIVGTNITGVTGDPLSSRGSLASGTSSVVTLSTASDFAQLWVDLYE